MNRHHKRRTVRHFQRLESRTPLAADLQFSAPVAYATGAGPEAVLAADLNGDQILDLITADFQDNAVSVFHGNGDGSFQTRRMHFAGQGPVAIAASPLRTDGPLNDLVVANLFTGDVSVLLAIGEGNFEPEVPYRAATFTVDLVTEDLNGDGHRDLAAVSSGSPFLPNGGGGVTLFAGDGSGTFATAELMVDLPGAASIAVADFNQDSFVDLAVGTENLSDVTEIALYFGDGTGTFTRGPAVWNESGADRLIASDLNADGHVDLVANYFASDRIIVLLADGHGGFHEGVRYTAGSGGMTGLIVTDLNADSFADVAVTLSRQGVVAALFGNGDGTLAEAQTFPVGEKLAGLTAGDFNQDGVIDLATTSQQTNEVLVIFGDLVVSPSLQAGDANGDGRFDSSDLIQVFQRGHYEDALVKNSTWADGDWNGDGEFDSSDLVAAFQTGAYMG